MRFRTSAATATPQDFYPIDPGQVASAAAAMVPYPLEFDADLAWDLFSVTGGEVNFWDPWRATVRSWVADIFDAGLRSDAILNELRDTLERKHLAAWPERNPPRSPRLQGRQRTHYLPR